MSWFGFKKRREAAKENTTQCEQFADCWNSTDFIYIGSQHISGSGMCIGCEVRYIPRERLVVCEMTSTNDATPRYDGLSVPSEIQTAEALIAFVTAHKLWLVHGYKMSDETKRRLDAQFNA